MDGSTQLPVLDFHNPWVALIQLALFFLLPQVVGYVTSKFTASKWKSLTLGGLAILASVLAKLLDVAVGNHWAEFDFMEIVNMVTNGVLTWFMANWSYQNFISKTNANAAAQASDTLSAPLAKVLPFLRPDPELVAAAEKKAA